MIDTGLIFCKKFTAFPKSKPMISRSFSVKCHYKNVRYDTITAKQI